MIERNVVHTKRFLCQVSGTLMIVSCANEKDCNKGGFYVQKLVHHTFELIEEEKIEFKETLADLCRTHEQIKFQLYIVKL